MAPSVQQVCGHRSETTLLIPPSFNSTSIMSNVRTVVGGGVAGTDAPCPIVIITVLVIANALVLLVLVFCVLPTATSWLVCS
jgi:hypothetical protein